MRRRVLVLAFAFAAAALTGAVASGCGGIFNDCGCPPTPYRPSATGPFTELTFSSFTPEGEAAATAVLPEDAVIVVTPDNLTITYRHDGVAHTVEYDVSPAL